MADGITYAGQPAVLDSEHQIRDYLATRWPDSRWPHVGNRLGANATPFPFFRKNRAGMFRSPYPECPSPKLNELIIPTGASRYARCLVIMDRESIEAMAPTVWGDEIDLNATLPDSWGNSQNAADLKFEYNGTVYSWPMYALAPVLLDATSRQSLWMLPLVDERYFWASTAASIDVTTIEEWSELLSSVTGITGTAITIDGAVNSAYGVPDKESLQDAQASCGEMIDAVALSTGRRYVPGTTHTLSLASTENTKLTTNLALPLWRLGGKVPTTAIQKKAVIVCRKAYDYWGDADELAIYEEDIDADSESKVSLVIFSAWWLEHFTDSSSGMPTLDAVSEAARDYLAATIADDHLQWGGKQFSASLAGVAEWSITGHDDYLSIACETIGGEMVLTTQVVSLPPDFGPRISIAQRPDVYVHPHEVARFEITSDLSGLRAYGSITKADGPYQTGDTAPIPIVLADTTASIASTVTCHYEHGVGWIQIGTGAGGNVAKLKFRATANIDYRTLPVVVLHSTGTSVAVSDELDIYDPNNLFSSATTGCIGTAYYNSTRMQWEIETCSLPANEIQVELDATLLAVDGSYTAMTTSDYYLRSTYPNVMKPPQCESSCTYTWNTSLLVWEVTTPCADGCECGTAPADPADTGLAGQTAIVPCTIGLAQIEIPFSNPWRVDGMCDSKAILRRVSNAAWGDTIEDAPETGSATAYRWEIVSAEKRKARFIQFTFASEAAHPTVTAFWDGRDPTECDAVDVTYPLGSPCEGDTVVASYNPESDTYVALDTQSSMMGHPVEQTLVSNVANDPCGISLAKHTVQVFPVRDEGICTNAETTSTVELGSAVTVLLSVGASEDCGTINYAYQTIRAFVCESEPAFSSFALDFGDASFVTGIAFGKEAACTGYATWTWNAGTEDWDLTTPCASGCEATKPVTPSAGILDLERTSLCHATGGVCGITVTSQAFADLCNTDYPGPPTTKTFVPLPLEQRVVLTSATLGTDLVFTREVLYVCAFEEVGSTTIGLYECPEAGSGG